MGVIRRSGSLNHRYFFHTSDMVIVVLAAIQSYWKPVSSNTVSGVEMMFADLGHFSPLSIKVNLHFNQHIQY